MHILVNNAWTCEFLDQTLLNNSVRIKTLAWFNLYKINDLYFIPEKSWRLVFNYAQEIGIKAVMRKIISRLSEAARNEKYLSVGVGIILDSQSTLFKKDDRVIFSALCHPRCMERIVLPEQLVFPAEATLMAEKLNNDAIFYTDMTNMAIPNKLHPYQGWSEYSGVTLPDTINTQLRSCLTEIKNKLDKVQTHQLPILAKASPQEFIPSTAPKSTQKLRASLFGYGQYAKTIILPSIKKWVDISTIHEIDATQLPIHKNPKNSYDSSPCLRRNDNKDNMIFIAGYHHTHARLAINALKADIAAIVEKPIVTTRKDLDYLLRAMKTSKAPLFSCFHKRYLPFNKFIRNDLGIHLKDPISYHCVVFEVPLPKLHWYRWPNSGSRLLSNGCHWIDYFLHLNNFSSVEKSSLQTAKNGDLTVFLELMNGAVFSMSLTEIGSHRLGIREHIELRAGKSTIVITDGCQYKAENSTKTLRKINVKRLSVYQTMYQQIVEKIRLNMPGDSITSVEQSTSTILSLEDLYQSQKFAVHQRAPQHEEA